MAIRIQYQLVGLGLLMIAGGQTMAETDSTNKPHKPHHHNVLKPFKQSMLAVLPSLQKINKDLIDLVQDLTYGKTPEQVVKELTDFFKDTQAPLIKAAVELGRQKKYVAASIKVAQALLNMLPSNSSYSGEVQEWISDLNTILTCVEQVLVVIKDNPQLVAIIAQ